MSTKCDVDEANIIDDNFDWDKLIKNIRPQVELMLDSMEAKEQQQL